MAERGGEASVGAQMEAWLTVQGAQGLRVGLLGAVLWPLLACGSFFQCQNKPACPTSTGTGTGTGTGAGSAVDFGFVSYTTSTGNAVVTGYNLSAGALTAINTVTLPFVPIAMVVNPKNSLLYVASVPGASNPGIYSYAIGVDGRLSAARGGNALVNDPVGAMTISPDGKFLFTVQALNQTMTEYAVDATDAAGGLKTQGVLTVLAPSCVPTLKAPVLPTCSVAVSPKGDYVVASLGSAGDAFFSYSSANGVPNSFFATVNAGAQSADFSVAIDGNDNAYVAQTATMTVFGLGSTTTVPPTRGVIGYPAGSTPRSTVVDPTSKFVYTANVGTGKISGFGTGTTNALTVLTGSPYAAPAGVEALGIDNTGTYLLAAGYDATAGVQLYSIAGTGVLTAVKSAGTSTQTQNSVLVAMSH